MRNNTDVKPLETFWERTEDLNSRPICVAKIWAFEDHIIHISRSSSKTDVNPCLVEARGIISSLRAIIADIFFAKHMY